MSPKETHIETIATEMGLRPAQVQATAGLLDGLALSEISRWLQLLLAFDIIFPAVAFMTFDYVVKE